MTPAAPLTVDRVLRVADAWLAVMVEMKLLELEIEMRSAGHSTEDNIATAIAWSRDHARRDRCEALAALAPQIEAALAEP